ncbi:MAG TPA: HEAT repeat domain-containing protein [Pirellulaceae bacterium]|nr:HEAT repeat domain-containing protein [Pirellulaceae bacterium]
MFVTPLRWTLLLAALTLITSPGSPLLAQKAVPENFKVELLYQVPEIEHPSVVACDDEGNLFIGEDPMDMRGPTSKHIDRIIYVKFDKATGQATKTVYAENLSAVFGMIWRDGALYVMHAPLYSVFRDTNGDGVADERQDLANGFGPPAGVYGFNDHIVTGTRLGIDNWLYISVGDKGIPKATGADGSTVTLEGGGVVRMKLNGTQLENLTSGTRNHLDVAIDPLDNIFTYDNTDDGLGWWTRFTHHVPTGYYGYPYDYHPHPERHLPRISEHQGGSPVGAACYNEAAWPERYRGAAFHCEWGKGKVQVFFPKKNGATFEATMEDFLIRDGKEEFRPLDLCFSPDGKYMYLADWNFGGWVNPKVCGRVFRISYVGTDVAAEPARASNTADLAAQVQALGHPAQSERLRAQHKLATLGNAAAAAVSKTLFDANAPKMARIHAIWTQNELIDHQAGYDPTEPWQKALREDKDGDVRAQAARALGERRLKGAVDALITACGDADASARMQVAIALGRLGDSKATGALFAGLDDKDAFVRHARIQALRAIGDWKLAGHYLQHANADIRSGTIIALTGQYSLEAVQALAAVVGSGADSTTRAMALSALSELHRKADPYEKGWWGTQPARGKPARSKVHGWDGTELVMKTLRDSLRHSDDAVRRVAVQSLSELKDAAAVPVAIEMAGDTKLNEELRRDALKILVANNAPEAGTAVMAILQEQGSPAPLVTYALEIAAEQKLAGALPGVQQRLDSDQVMLQVAALGALARIVGERATDRLALALKSNKPELVQAAARIAGENGLQSAIPALLEVASQGAHEYEATMALAAMPDRRALGLYLQGATSKNNVLRDKCRAALIAIKGDIVADIIERHQRNELSPEMRRELQAVLAAPVVVREWQLIGTWSREPGEPKFDATQPPKLAEPIMLGDKPVKWQRMLAQDADGRISPAKYVKGDNDVWVLAYAEITAPLDHQAEFLLGSDDQAVLWVNGQRVSQFGGNRGWTPGQDRGQVALKKGVNQIYFLSGNSSGPWDFSLAMRMQNPDVAFLYENVPAALDVASFREFALQNAGNAERGRAIFSNEKGVACIKCHAVSGQGGKIGPDLLGVGTKYPREELVRSILEPSNRVAESYLVTTIITDGGQTISGIIKSETETELELVDAAGKITKLAKSTIEDRQKSNLSLMPNGLKDGLTLADFADVVAYMESLKQGN